MFIRPARPAERKALEALQRRASLNNPGDREALLANPDAIDLPDAQIAAGRVFVALRDGTLAGFSAVVPRPDGEVDLDGLFVEPAMWRGGIGRALVEHAAERARTLGARALYVIGNPHAEGFYLSVGFRITGAFDTRFGPGLLMKMVLPAPAMS
ncbi:MAG: GNAT family N-acetyltransferase [Cucumibacter sp.]